MKRARGLGGIGLAMVLASSSVSYADEPLPKSAVITYRFPRWVPWTVVGSGVAVGGVGALLMYSAGQDMNEFDNSIARDCATGCDPNSPAYRELLHLRDRAVRKDHIGVAGVVVGSAALITGLVLVFLNEPKIQYVDVAPTAGGATASLALTF